MKPQIFAWLIAPWLGLALLTLASAADPGYAEVETLLKNRCVMCHSGASAPLGLRLDSREGLLKGSSRGPVVVAGKPEQSELVRRIKGLSQPRMPMTGPPYLDDREIALIEGWIAAGMPAGAPAAAAPPTGKAEPAAKGTLTYADVKTIFDLRCTRCHAEQGLMGPAPEGYRLTSYAAALASTERARIVPNHPEASELVRRIKGHSRPRMPFDGPPYLEQQQIEQIVTWISQGAVNADLTPAVYPLGARIRTQGRLVERWQLEDGLQLAVTPNTRVDKSPRAGDYVEVRGRLGKAGAIDVERIRRR